MWSERFEPFKGAPWTPEGKQRDQELEKKSQEILPFVEQTAYFRGGMRQQFTPEQFNLKPSLVEQFHEAGNVIQDFLGEIVEIKSTSFPAPDQFRIDFILDENNQLKIAEIQPDDRGLPPAAIFRNAYGPDRLLPGVIPVYIEKNTSESNSLVAIVVPRSQQFYYQGFKDFCQIARASTRKEIWLAYPDQITPNAKKLFLKANPSKPITAIQLFLGPNREENSAIEQLSSTSSNFGIQIINPPSPLFESKLPLALAWSAEFENTSSILAKKIRKFIPSTYIIDSDTGFQKQLKKERDNWVIKPISGAWSQGVNIGWCLGRAEWNLAVDQATQNPETQIAQQFVWARPQQFPVRKKAGVFSPQDFYLRVEGYYFTLNGETKLADILVTGRPELPVHGRRDCIMTPAFTSKT